MLRSFPAGILIALCLFTGLAAAQGTSGPMVEASLVSERSSVAPGETFHLALHQEITPHWHTYWRNPGDSGEATRLFLDLPEGWTVGEMAWPAPSTYRIGPLTNYGYEDQVTLPVPVTVPADAEPGPVTITGEGTWLVCEDICIPEDANFEITLEVGESAVDRQGAALIETAFSLAPRTDIAIEAGLARKDDVLALTLAGDSFAGGADAIRDLYFFPHDSGVVNHSAPQPARVEAGFARIDLTPGFLTRNAINADHTGALAFEARIGNRWERRVIEVTAIAGEEVNTLAAPVSAPAAGSGEGGGTSAPAMSFWQAALFALVGGLILNLMPCVFPILSMKALTIVQKRGAERAHARELGLIFGAGVIATFLALGGLVLALRGLGGMEVWGFQLQEPWVVAGLAALMFVIGLNFLGFFEIGTSLQSVGGHVQGNDRSGAFLTGVLAVFVAAPCLAPVMASALAFALAQPPLASLTIFAFLGVGLALPFVIVSFEPRLLAFLPKPGVWMERFKQFLAFPMFATAIWLVWVLSVQTGAQGVLWILVLFLAISFAVWALRSPTLMSRAAGVAGVLLAAGALWTTASLEPAAIAAGNGEYEEWSPARVEELRAEGRPVFVDFTAAWCVTCQVNKLGALADNRVRSAFAENNVALLRADFTNRDPVIAQVLADHGAPGVPFYLMYPADGGEPDILPPLLTETIMIRAVEAAAGN
ncbi:protein-disulfide reductase DsbD family protein [Glycocaulis abyssi]|uniref:Protein-disulfide reductase DsbD family protein n=1 Tax=Glycocaulis abyssi TaxID=1433403 RepID=A0ABV9NEQ4_9PROT